MMRRLFARGQLGCMSYICSGGEEGEGAAWFAGGADGDFDVLAEGGEKFHEAAGVLRKAYDCQGSRTGTWRGAKSETLRETRVRLW